MPLQRQRDQTGDQNMQKFLESLHACSEAKNWVGDKTINQAWAECPRADWMMWLLGSMIDKPGWPTRQQVVLLACDCAETALKYVPEGEDRPRQAILTTRAWARGEASIEQVRAAAYAAYAYVANAAYAAYAAAYAANAAARAAYDAAYAAADAADAARAAANAAAYDAANAAAYDAADAAAADAGYEAVFWDCATDAADADAKANTLSSMADMIRTKVPSLPE
jgi:hypothetical protein